jgi:hypothetical protein
MSHGAAEAGAATDPAAGPDDPQLESEGAGQGQAGSGGGETPDPEAEKDWQAEAQKWQRLSRQNEAKAKENAKAAAEFKKWEDSQKTEVQRAQERAEEAERQRDEALRTHHQLMAAATFDLHPDLIEFLGSGTEDEIGERAETLSNTVKQQATDLARQIVEGMGLQFPGSNGQPGTSPTAQGAAGMARRPVEALVSGTNPSNGGQPTTTEGWMRAMLAGEIS